MSAPEIGLLRHRMALEAPVAGAGGMLVYETRSAPWASIQQTATGLTITMRTRGDIAAGWRLRQGLRLFEILSIARDHAHSGVIVCACREITA